MTKFEIKPWIAKKADLPRKFEAELIRETEKATMIKFDDKEFWLPKSQIVFCGASTPAAAAPSSAAGVSSSGKESQLFAQVANLARCAAARIYEQNEGFDGEISAKELLVEVAKRINSKKKDDVTYPDREKVDYDHWMKVLNCFRRLKEEGISNRDAG